MNKVAYVGIDVQARRGCPYAVLDERLNSCRSGWLESPSAIGDIVDDLLKVFDRVAVGIDAPRFPLPAPRAYYRNGRNWRPRRPSDKGWGRHCEVVVASFGLGNPQWTPLADNCPEWMRIGFSLFSALSQHADVYEVFPTASYHQLTRDQGAQLSICLADFEHGPKDMLDAYVAAFTVHEFLAGRGTEVGGGDRLGSIVLPRKLSPKDSDVLRWPED